MHLITGWLLLCFEASNASLGGKNPLETQVLKNLIGKIDLVDL